MASARESCTRVEHLSLLMTCAFKDSSRGFKRSLPCAFGYCVAVRPATTFKRLLICPSHETQTTQYGRDAEEGD